MRLSSDLVGFIELDDDIACERLLSWDDGRHYRARAETAEAEPAIFVCANLASLRQDLRQEWLAVLAEFRGPA